VFTPPGRLGTQQLPCCEPPRRAEGQLIPGRPPRRSAPLQVALDPAGKFPWWSWSVAVCSGRVRWRCGRLTIRWISECLEDGGVVGYVYVRPVLVFEILVLASQLTDGQSW